MKGVLGLSSLVYLRPNLKRVLVSFTHFADKIWTFLLIGSFLSIFLASSCWYLFSSNSHQPFLKNYEILNSNHSKEKGFNCLANGRNDIGYLKWRWKPNNCEIPKLNVLSVLEKLRGKRVVFVGDSLGRTQWESMICMLMEGIEDKRSVYEVNGNKITKQIRHLSVRFSTYNLMIEFYRSIFLVQPNAIVPKHSPKRVRSTIQLDKLDNLSNEWVDSDFLIFNSAHWWTPTKLFEMGCYFQIGGKLKLGMSLHDAFRTAVTTWGNWIQNSIEPNRTMVFFRTFESSHWSGKTCKVTKQPLVRTRGREHNLFSDIVMKSLKDLSVSVTSLRVTQMGAFRSDAHVGIWSDNPTVADCSHWCLPGLPETWNEILFAYVVKQDGICKYFIFH
ncbi:protein trichome berefringence-like 7 isoform X2 [Impatiens glandulifera]|uniref:protein trichome berefringence-like 7 isoform X2 n=1 Tax=Impatiens glandulifera TaxID=253017 RepID=UPI001FB0DA53|nr:protein trichome berefringence-like 7 isoform X2 [Impatiens glandulifera]